MMLDMIARIGLLIFTETPEVAGQSTFTPTPDSSAVNTGATAQLPLNEEPIAGDTAIASNGQTTEPIVVPYFVDAQGVQTPIETYTVKLDDGSEATLEELRQGNLRQADYTRKTQELAEERNRVEAWRVYYEQNPQAVANPQNVAPQVRSGFDALTEADYATDTERHLATELRDTREELAQVNERMTAYDTRLANNEAANADAQLTSVMTQWGNHFGVTELEILDMHSETGVSNVKVLAEIAKGRKQASAVPVTQQVAQTIEAAAATQVVAQRPQATQQTNEIKIDFTKPVGQRLAALRAKYPNI